MFPPKQWDKIEGTKAVVKEMVKSHPAFMSVTYGAAGTTSGFTTEIAREILDDGVTLCPSDLPDLYPDKFIRW